MLEPGAPARGQHPPNCPAGPGESRGGRNAGRDPDWPSDGGRRATPALAAPETGGEGPRPVTLGWVSPTPSPARLQGRDGAHLEPAARRCARTRKKRPQPIRADLTWRDVPGSSHPGLRPAPATRPDSARAAAAPHSPSPSPSLSGSCLCRTPSRSPPPRDAELHFPQGSWAVDGIGVRQAQARGWGGREGLVPADGGTEDRVGSQDGIAAHLAWRGLYRDRIPTTRKEPFVRAGGFLILGRGEGDSLG